MKPPSLSVEPRALSRTVPGARAHDGGRGAVAYHERVTAAPLRVARGSAVAAVALLLAAAGHTAAAGAAPAVGPLPVAGALLVLVGCVLASERSWTPPRLLVALAGVQAVSHLVLSGPSGPLDPRLAGLVRAAHTHAHGAAGSPTMLLAHVLAAAAAALLLARVDAAVTTLWHLLRHALGGLHLQLVPLALASGPAMPALTTSARGRSAARAPSRRGPPYPSCP